jgi:hypothetical protein
VRDEINLRKKRKKTLRTNASLYIIRTRQNPAGNCCYPNGRHPPAAQLNQRGHIWPSAPPAFQQLLLPFRTTVSTSDC